LDDCHWQVFEPFHWTVWLMCIFITFLVSSIQQLVFLSDSQARATVCAMIADRSECSLKSVGHLFNELAQAGGVHSLLFLGRDEAFPPSSSLLIIAIGWGFFILIVSNAYTANLAAFLIHENLGDYYHDMTEAVNKGARICTPSSLIPLLKNEYKAAILVPIEYFSEENTQRCDAYAWSYAAVRRPCQ
jgi:hypothetical protein